MFKIESNIEALRHQLKDKVDKLIDADKLFREACLDTIVLISDRVQQKGIGSEGQKLETKGNKKYGSYTYNYGKYKRAKEGLQTEHIDLTFSGDMFNDFTFAPDGETSYVVGFRGQDSSDKADWNERKFGPIFQLSEKEKEEIQELITNRINAILNK